MQARPSPTVLLLVLLSLSLASCDPYLADDGSSHRRLAELEAPCQRDPAAAVIQLRQFLESHPADDLGWTMLGHVCHDVDLLDDSTAAYRQHAKPCTDLTNAFHIDLHGEPPC